MTKGSSLAILSFWMVIINKLADRLALLYTASPRKYDQPISPFLSLACAVIDLFLPELHLSNHASGHYLMLK